MRAIGSHWPVFLEGKTRRPAAGQSREARQLEPPRANSGHRQKAESRDLSPLLLLLGALPTAVLLDSTDTCACRSSSAHSNYNPAKAHKAKRNFLPEYLSLSCLRN